MKILLTLCPAILLLASWSTFANDKSYQCSVIAHVSCIKYIEHTGRYSYCVDKEYKKCMRQ